ncbi:MAG: hypothetical protein SNG27_00195 [Rikenellaceae bacterium]
MFVSEPEAFASFRGKLLFEYEQEEESELVFEIELAEDGDYVEVKKLYGVDGATINVAHVVANRFMTEPSSGVSSLETPQSGYGLVAVKCGDESTEAQYFVAAKSPLPEVGVLATMPLDRIISYGEADEVWIRAGEGAQVLVMVECEDEGGTTSTTFEHTVEGCGLARFRFATEDFSCYTKIAHVEIYCDGESLAQMRYCYVPSVWGAVRLAWIGEWGGVEHYTFPVTNSLSLLANGARHYEVESAYESSSVVEALAEIVTSERVWIVEDGEYIEVDMLSELVLLNKRRELATAEFKFARYD